MSWPKPLAPASQFQVRIRYSWFGLPSMAWIAVAPPIIRNLPLFCVAYGSMPLNTLVRKGPKTYFTRCCSSRPLIWMSASCGLPRVSCDTSSSLYVFAPTLKPPARLISSMASLAPW